MNFSRRIWLKTLSCGVVPATAGAFGYGSLIERNQLTVTRKQIPLSKNHAPLDQLKIAVMSDFHHDDFGNDELIWSAVQSVNRESVDFVMLLGDFVSSDHRSMPPLMDQLRHLNSRLGTFAVPGNHDQWYFAERLPNYLDQAGIRLLANEAVDCDEFSIAGVDSIWGGKPRLASVLKSCRDGKPILLGWHEPDTFVQIDDERVVLQMSGHTHGGQVCAPIWGPLILPRFGKIYPYGLFHKEPSALFVTRGIGTLTLPVRFLCPPELAILTLTGN